MAVYQAKVLKRNKTNLLPMNDFNYNVFMLGNIVIMVKKTYRNYPRKQEDSFFFRSSKINEDIITGEKLSSIYLANKELVYCSVRSYSSRGKKGGRRESLF